MCIIYLRARVEYLPISIRRFCINTHKEKMSEERDQKLPFALEVEEERGKRDMQMKLITVGIGIVAATTLIVGIGIVTLGAPASNFNHTSSYNNTLRENRLSFSQRNASAIEDCQACSYHTEKCVEAVIKVWNLDLMDKIDSNIAYPGMTSNHSRAEVRDLITRLRTTCF